MLYEGVKYMTNSFNGHLHAAEQGLVGSDLNQAMLDVARTLTTAESY